MQLINTIFTINPGRGVHKNTVMPDIFALHFRNLRSGSETKRMPLPVDNKFENCSETAFSDTTSQETSSTRPCGYLVLKLLTAGIGCSKRGQP